MFQSVHLSPLAVPVKMPFGNHRAHTHSPHAPNFTTTRISEHNTPHTTTHDTSHTRVLQVSDLSLFDGGLFIGLTTAVPGPQESGFDFG